MNYGDFLVRATGGILISYKEYGDYQGDYVAILEVGHNWHIYKGTYGSCGGCDWLKGTSYWDEEKDALSDIVIESDEVKKYMKDNLPFLVIPKDQLPETEEDLEALLPANTRTMNIEYDDVDTAPVLFKQMKEFKFDNLKYLEHKADENNI